MHQPEIKDNTMANDVAKIKFNNTTYDLRDLEKAKQVDLNALAGRVTNLETLPAQVTQIGLNLDNLTTQVTSNTANIARLQLSLPTMTSEDGFYICDGNGYVAFSVTPTDGVKYIGQISYKSLE